MKLLIDIPEEVYKHMIDNRYTRNDIIAIHTAINYGKALSDITDEQISYAFQIAIANYWESKSKYLTPPPTPTIIEPGGGILLKKDKKVCISVKELYNAHPDGVLSYVNIIHTTDEPSEYFDLYDDSGNLLCSDSEEAIVVKEDKHSITFKNTSSDAIFKLSRDECNIAIFKEEACPISEKEIGCF